MKKIGNSEMRQFARRAKRHGWTWDYTRNGHLCFTSPAGERIYGPSTPSDRRSLANMRAEFRRRGVRL